MRNLFWVLILLNLAISCGDGFKKNTKKNGPFQNSQEVDTFSINQQYLELVNEHRIALRLKPLTYNPIVEEIALGHSKAMASHARPFGHVGFNVRCRRLINRFGSVDLCGEIVAMGQKNIKAVFQAWMDSPKHRQELEQPFFTHTGLGIHKDLRGVFYWTQIFVEL